ncbi:MAG: winged helix-turn-helix domain-containing protein [Pseudonocardia sp.]
MPGVPTTTTGSPGALTISQARRAALAAQGFAEPRPRGPLTRRHLARLTDRLRLLQLDSVNVAVRAHYMPVFSRLGGYPRELLDEAAWAPHTVRRPRMLVEHWAHEACLLPAADWPLLRSGAKRAGWWRHYGELARRESVLVAEVLAAVEQVGPVGAGELERMLGGAPRAAGAGGSWWDRSEVKRICEYLFGTGQLTTGTRLNFQRLYDLPERVLPPAVLAAPPPAREEAARRLVTHAATALGVASEPELRDYYRLGPAECRAAVAELVADGELEAVPVQGWRAPAYRRPGTRVPRRVDARALLCPFDPLIWERARTERLFGFRYRIEIYTPAARREYGYYVFPFLLGDALVARVDLKADRAAGVLRVPGAFGEPGPASVASPDTARASGTSPARVAAELAAELRSMAEWLGLGGVLVGDRGDLAGPLAAELRAQAA